MEKGKIYLGTLITEAGTGRTNWLVELSEIDKFTTGIGLGSLMVDYEDFINLTPEMVGKKVYFQILNRQVGSSCFTIAKILRFKNEEIRPCDCKDAVDVAKLEEQGFAFNDDSIKVIPNVVVLKIGHTEITIPMKRFEMLAEWYLKPQNIKS